MIAKLMLLYGYLTFAVIVNTYYLPFLMADHGYSNTQTGVVTALYFIGMSTPGIALRYIVVVFRRFTMSAAFLIMGVGMATSFIFSGFGVYIVGSMLMGFGYGMAQPMLYDKATNSTLDSNKVTQRLSLLLTANYVALGTMPFIMKGIEKLLFHSESISSPYIFNTVGLSLLLILSIVCCKSYLFTTDKEFYT